MINELGVLELKRAKLRQQIDSIGDFRFGSISASFRKCGKKRCVCAQKNHPGHGPQYLCTAKRDGKSVAQYLRLGPELDLAQEQLANGRRFNEWYREYTELNAQICRMRQAPQIEDEQELELLKKKLRAKFARK